jgi:hypothetical protein
MVRGRAAKCGECGMVAEPGRTTSHFYKSHRRYMEAPFYSLLCRFCCLTIEKLRSHCTTFKLHRERTEYMKVMGKGNPDERYLVTNNAPYPANVIVFSTEESVAHWAALASAKEARKAAAIPTYTPTPIVMPVPGASSTTTVRHATPGPGRGEQWAPEDRPALPTALVEVALPAPTAPVAAVGRLDLLKEFEEWIHDLPDVGVEANGGCLGKTEGEGENILPQLMGFLPDKREVIAEKQPEQEVVEERPSEREVGEEKQPDNIYCSHT